jgi:CBS domain-containing protein
MAKSEPLWPRAILRINSTIEQAVHVLNETSVRIVLITDASDILVGTISDGDIRRGLLKGLNLTSPIESIIHHDALVVPPELSRDTVVQLMTANC